MQRRILFQAVPLLFAALAITSCNTSNNGTETMKSKPDNQGSGIQADPKMYQLNSVLGEVKSGGKAVPDATVTIVATGEKVPVEAGGFYILVLDPAKLGKRPKELLFAAPGYAEQRHAVLVPENKQVRLNVELVRAP